MATIQLPRYILESVGSLGVPGLSPPNGVPQETPMGDFT